MTPDVSRSSLWTRRGLAPLGLAKAAIRSSRVLAAIRPPWLDSPAGLAKAMTSRSSWMTRERTKAISAAESGVTFILRPLAAAALRPLRHGASKSAAPPPPHSGGGGSNLSSPAQRGEGDRTAEGRGG